MQDGIYIDIYPLLPQSSHMRIGYTPMFVSWSRVGTVCFILQDYDWSLKCGLERGDFVLLWWMKRCGGAKNTSWVPIWREKHAKKGAFSAFRYDCVLNAMSFSSLRSLLDGYLYTVNLHLEAWGINPVRVIFGSTEKFDFFGHIRELLHSDL